LAASKRERIERLLRDISSAHPFASLQEARSAVEGIIRQVEDELSGIPENPKADETTVSDGRMYPPSDKYETKQKSPSVRTFRQLAHRTSFGENGAILIQTLAGSGVLDLPGKDGRRISDLLQE
jgi:hypothetical protein